MEKNGFVPAGILRLCKGPWISLGVAGIILFVTFAIQRSLNISIVPLVFVGVVAAGVGVAVRPGDWLVLLAASGCSLLAVGSLLLEWDSMRLLFGVLAIVAAISAVLVTLPRILRRMAFSCLILFHFAGICCAVLNVNPAPWLTSYLWSNYFQSYLNFIYMTNAYHFYAPEPGPGIMLWFDVRYDDGSDQWVKLPVRENQRWLLNYQRRLSLPEGANQVVNMQSLPAQEILMARAVAGQRDGIPFYYGPPNAAEYRPPNYSSKFMLESYARHIAHTTPHPTDPSRQVVGVKAYRVVHRMMTAKEVALGAQPDKKWMYQPFFQGEFDVDGQLKNPQDPYLYWLIPIVNKKTPGWSSGQSVEADTLAALHQEDDILDCLEIHANLPTILPPNQPNLGLGAAPIPGNQQPNPQKLDLGAPNAGILQPNQQNLGLGGVPIPGGEVPKGPPKG